MTRAMHGAGYRPMRRQSPPGRPQPRPPVKARPIEPLPPLEPWEIELEKAARRIIFAKLAGKSYLAPSLNGPIGHRWRPSPSSRAAGFRPAISLNEGDRLAPSDFALADGVSRARRNRRLEKLGRAYRGW
jgi:hypothetical protein